MTLFVTIQQFCPIYIWVCAVRVGVNEQYMTLDLHPIHQYNSDISICLYDVVIFLHNCGVCACVCLCVYLWRCVL